MLNWFNALIFGAVLLILIIAAGRAVSDIQPFEPLELAGAVVVLLILPVLLKLASRRPKERSGRRK
jgi:hypothetical protein